MQVDVDIFFEEDASIGVKVQLCEKIIRVMRTMQCPHPLQANQIQGSDWANVLPVIVWLVDKFAGFRRETQGKLRLYAHQQFGKNYALPHEGGYVEQCSDSSVEGLLGAIKRYAPQRIFRLGVNAARVRRNTEESRVHAALLEYGETMRARRGLAGSGDGAGAEGGATVELGGSAILMEKGSLSIGREEQRLSAFERKLVNEAKKAAAVEAALAREMAVEEGHLLEGMQSIAGDDTESNASKTRVGNIMSIGTDAIAAAAARYELDVEEVRRRLNEQESSFAAGGRMSVGTFKRRLEVLKQQRDTLKPKLAEAKGARVAAEAMLATNNGTLVEMQAEMQRLRALMEGNGDIAVKEQAAQASGRDGDLKELKELVLKNEGFKRKIESFREGVKRERNEMQAELTWLDAAEKERERLQTAGHVDEEMARLNQIEVMHTKIMAKYDRLRQLLAERNLTLSSGMRAIDDIPTRTELIQYERRFTELYQQVALKLGENKKFIDCYNTLDETYRMLQKEVSLVNSITDNFDAAMKSKASKEQFLQQFEGILKGVEDSVVAKKAQLKVREGRLAQLTDVYEALVTEQRCYYEAVKTFQEECDRNEFYARRVAEFGYR